MKTKQLKNIYKSISTIKSNAEFHTIMADLYSMPLWINKDVYDYLPPNTDKPLTPWSDIGPAFSLTQHDLELLKILFTISDDYGTVSFDVVDSLMGIEDLASLVEAEVMQKVDDETYVVNPSIIWGRSYLSPFTKGLLVSYWINCKEPLVAYDPLRIHKFSLDATAGFRSANLRGVKLDIENSVAHKKSHESKVWERLDELEAND